MLILNGFAVDEEAVGVVVVVCAGVQEWFGFWSGWSGWRRVVGLSGRGNRELGCGRGMGFGSGWWGGGWSVLGRKWRVASDERRVGRKSRILPGGLGTRAACWALVAP